MFSRKQNVSPDNVFLFETLHTTPWRQICLMQDATCDCDKLRHVTSSQK